MTNHAPHIPGAPAPEPIPVLCDRCLEEGIAGEDPFAAFGDLIDFAPVPRRKKRADGWSEEVQRAFIVALASTGSARQAAAAVGKAQFGADQLRRVPGNEGFLAAWEKALDHYEELRRQRLAAGLHAVAGRGSAWSRQRAPWSGTAARRALPAPPPEPQGEEASRAQKEEWVRDILRTYWLKVQQERTCRLAGKVIEADFYVRQLTWLEVVVDLMSEDAVRAFSDFRKDGHRLPDIAETPFSRILGETRRHQWRRLGDPDRPEHPPRDHLRDHGGFSTEPHEALQGGIELSLKEQERQREERHRKAAAEQLEWEAEARRDHERRREATPLMEEASVDDLPQAGGEANGASAGQPAPEGRQD